jgi:hypothetical protein
MATPSTINQDIFDKKYTDELDRLVMGGLSIQLAIPAALTLAQASTPNPTPQQTQQNLTQGTTPEINKVKIYFEPFSICSFIAQLVYCRYNCTFMKA